MEHHASTTSLVSTVPLAPRAGHTQFTPRFALCSVGPIDLLAGDYVRTTIAGQLDNENAEAGAAWRERVMRNVWLADGGTRLEKVFADIEVDPRWSLWIGWNVGAWRRQSPPPTGGFTTAPGTEAIRERGANWDNWRHHEPFYFSQAGEISADAPGSYFYAAAWFDTNPDYRLPTSYVEIVNRNRIEVEVYR